MGKTVLIVDDEKSIVDIVEFNLKKAGYDTITAYDGADGLSMAQTLNPDLILLDVMLPKMNGFEVCKTIRQTDIFTPIILLTAREDETDKVLGLELGADDYMTKPFSIKELLARVKAIIRRTGRELNHDTEVVGDVIAVGNLSIHTGRMDVTKDGKLVELSQREYDLLMYLYNNKNKVISREELMEKVWNFEFYGDLRTVNVAVSRLREKLEDNPAEPMYILTRRGTGYLFNSD